jgi:hypothetical protein
MVACVAGVPIVVVALIWQSFGVPVASFRPFINDEVTYWHQAATFAAAGFGGGFYTSAEVTNPSGLTPFGAHGPGFPLVYGLFGALFTWRPFSPVAANLVFVSLAVWLCLSLARATTVRALLLAALLCTFWPLLFWAPTAMQESLHHAGAVAMAGCVAGVLRPQPSRAARVLGWILLAALAFIRPSWLVVMPVWAVAVTWGRRPGVIVAALVGAVALALTVLVAYGRTAAPFVPPFFFLRATSGGLGVATLLDNLSANLRMTADLSAYEPVEVLLRAQYWIWLAVATVIAVVALMRRSSDMSSTPRGGDAAPHLAAGAVAMAGALGLMLVLYTLTNATEHRVLSAFLLFAAALAALAPGRAAPVLAVALVASNLVTASTFLQAFTEERQANFVWDRRPQRELQTALATAGIAFRPGEDRWCNTLLVSQFPPFLTAVPPGIGLSVVREPDQLTLPMRSRYALLDERALADFARAPRIEPLARLPYGMLYRNLDAECR